MSYVYEGQDQFPASLTLPDDSDSPNQSNFGPGWEGNRDAVVYLRNRASNTALMNFHAAVAPPSGSDNWLAAVFDAGEITSGGITIQLYNRWRATSDAGGTGGHFCISVDGGLTWTNVASTSGAFVPLAKCLTFNASIFAHFGAASKVYYNGGPVTTINTNSSAGWNATQGVAYNHSNGKSYFVGANQTGAPFTGAAAEFNFSGPVVTNKSGALPAGWASGTNHVGEYFFATNGASFIVAMGGITGGTDTARLLNAGDLSAPTDITPSIFTNKVVSGFTYDRAKSLWAVCLHDNTNTTIYTSPDLTTWTLQRTVNSFQFTSFYAIGGTWMLGCLNDALIGAASTHATFFSTTDMGANFSKAMVDVDRSFPYFTAAGTGSILIGNNLGVQISQFVKV